MLIPSRRPLQGSLTQARASVVSVLQVAAESEEAKGVERRPAPCFSGQAEAALCLAALPKFHCVCPHHHPTSWLSFAKESSSL